MVEGGDAIIGCGAQTPSMFYCSLASILERGLEEMKRTSFSVHAFRAL